MKSLIELVVEKSGRDREYAIAVLFVYQVKVREMQKEGYGNDAIATYVVLQHMSTVG